VPVEVSTVKSPILNDAVNGNTTAADFVGERGTSHICDAPLRITHTIGSIASRHGGPSRTVPALCDALGEIGFHVSLLARETCGPHSFTGTLKNRIRRQTTDVVHDHGLWLANNHRVARLSRTYGIPRIVSPRGMLAPWALNFKKLRKTLAWHLYQRYDLLSADVVHVTSMLEASEARDAGVTGPLAVIANGVHAPPTASTGANRDDRTALFLSRIHPKKGVTTLLNAWSRVRPRGWTLKICGPGEAAHCAEARQIIAREGLDDSVVLVGEVGDDEKWEHYAAADLFVLPTFAENFGVVIAEALAAGLPVITTKAAPWESLTTRQCGWWIDVGLEPLVAALREVTNLTTDQLHVMGRRGRDFAITEFSWQRAAAEMSEVYRWMVGAADRPPFVLLD
jgi:glycosyltransferase involved in cell wall biosynthesis